MSRMEYETAKTPMLIQPEHRRPFKYIPSMQEYPARPLCIIKKRSPPLDLDKLVSDALGNTPTVGPYHTVTPDSV